MFVMMSFAMMSFAMMSFAAPAAVQAKVLFSWQGSKDNHLSLVRGEVVRVLQQSEKWWSGEMQGQVGWFPKTFVKILEPEPEATPTKTTPTSVAENDAATLQYEAIYDYVGEAEGDLAFQAGDIIEVSEGRVPGRGHYRGE
jgi:hypothetical protein